LIAKTESINFTANALAYCERGGEVLYQNQCFGNAKDLAAQFKERHAYSQSTKPTYHAKIRIAPEDKGKLNTQEWIDIANKFTEQMGLDKNPYSVFIHEEGSDKEHIHLVGSRLLENNLVASDSYTHFKCMDFCREIEAEYNLRKVRRKLEAFVAGVEFESSDKRLISLRRKVDNAIDFSDSMDDFIFHLKNNGVKTIKSRGISFVMDGIKVKGSKLGREYSLKNIEKRINLGIEINCQTEQVSEVIIEKPITENNHFVSDDHIPIHFFKKAGQEDEREDGLKKKSWHSKKGMGR